MYPLDVNKVGSLLHTHCSSAAEFTWHLGWRSMHLVHQYSFHQWEQVTEKHISSPTRKTQSRSVRGKSETSTSDCLSSSFLYSRGREGLCKVSGMLTHVQFVPTEENIKWIIQIKKKQKSTSPCTQTQNQFAQTTFPNNNWKIKNKQTPENSIARGPFHPHCDMFKL